MKQHTINLLAYIGLLALLFVAGFGAGMLIQHFAGWTH